MTRSTLIAIAFAVSSLVGCSKTDSALSGTVTFDGQPVPEGEIILSPDTTRGNQGPGVMARISNGKYATPDERGHWGGGV